MVTPLYRVSGVCFMDPTSSIVCKLELSIIVIDVVGVVIVCVDRLYHNTVYILYNNYVQ